MSNTTGRGRRDTIQISLGSTANAITAHLLNLQGLAATTNTGGDDNDDAICDIQTTHHVKNDYWLPRTLIVDEPTRYFVAPQVSDACLQQQQQQQHLSSFSVEPFTDPNLTLQHEKPKWDSILSNASVLAYSSSYSRYYHQEEEEPTKYKASQSNPRHVVWDDDEDEEETEIEDPYDRKVRLQQQHNNWNQNIRNPMQEQILEQTNSQELFEETFNFMDFFMPPYSPKSLLSIPYSNQSNLASHWNTYNITDSIIKEWKEDILFEGLRRLLEESDGCQGVSILTEGSGLYAGLTTSLLHELQEECTSAGRIVYHVTNPMQHPSNAAVKTVQNDESEKDSSWHGIHVDRLRRNIGTGFALHDFGHNAHAVLPLQLPSNTNFFEATATLALALEASTLPVRLHPRKDPRYQIGLQNVPFFGGNGTSWGSSGQSLSVSELLQCLQPSSRYPVLELDALLPSTKHQNNAEHLWNKLKAGTSLERDQRTRESGRDGQLRRPQDTAPGLWLDDVRHGGILQSLSHNDGENTNTSSRSLHHHFALGVSIRTQLQDDLSNYSTCIVQGMGIRYRPERAMSAVLDQTISQLTHNGGGAGSYWGRLMESSVEHPVVAVVGNTTRIYPYLDKTASEFKSVLGTQYRGYYQRDLVNGMLPEIEDCEEALADCLDIRDTYHPPDGSGLVGDDDGEDFM